MENKDPKEIMKLAKEALLNTHGAYGALKLLGAEKHLPGLKECEMKRDEAIKAIDNYLCSF